MSRREDWADPDARYAWDHDDPLGEDEDNLLPPAAECNPATVSMTEAIADPDKNYCPF